MQAQAVEILVGKCRFEPSVAVGVAEAIDVSVSAAQFVTVPVLDFRLQELKSELKTDIGAVREELKVGLAEVRGEIKVGLAQVKGELKAEIHAVKAELVRWVFITMVGNVALSLAAQVTLNLLK